MAGPGGSEGVSKLRRCDPSVTRVIGHDDRPDVAVGTLARTRWSAGVAVGDRASEQILEQALEVEIAELLVELAEDLVEAGEGPWVEVLEQLIDDRKLGDPEIAE